MKKIIENSWINIVCNKCGKDFFVYPYRAYQAKYCSRECKAVYKKKNCLVCQKIFRPKYPGTAKYCSQECYGIAERGRKPWSVGIKANEDERIKRFVEAGHKATKGQIAWNKNLTWGNSAWLRKNNPNKYRNIHKKIYELFGSPKKCKECGKIGNNRQIHWANTNGQYLIKRKDWIRLCVKCHIVFDKSNKTKKELGL